MKSKCIASKCLPCPYQQFGSAEESENIFFCNRQEHEELHNRNAAAVENDVYNLVKRYRITKLNKQCACCLYYDRYQSECAEGILDPFARDHISRCMFFYRGGPL